MKNLFIPILLFSLSFFSIDAVADEGVCNEAFGVLRCGSGSIDHIFHLGNVFLSGTHVLSSLNATGNLQADNAEIGMMNITGNVDATHLIVHNTLRSIGIFHIENGQFDAAANITGNVQGKHDLFNADTTMTGDVTLSSESFKGLCTITGNISAELSTFAAPLALNACLAELSQTSTQQIQMTKQQGCPDNVEKLYLRNKTLVNGNIVFPGGNGQVYLSKDSIIKGQVNGGTIISL